MASTSGYTGPSVSEMFKNHTISKEIIARANDPEPILDAYELALLKRFVAAPETKSDILRELGYVDANGKVVEGKTDGGGSLVTYIMIQSALGNDLLSEGEIAELKEWFGNKA